MQSLAPALAPIVGTPVPGFGGSVLALGLGAAMQIFSNRIIAARTENHRTAANVRRWRALQKDVGARGVPSLLEWPLARQAAFGA
jgi:hypothetical protein